MNAATLLCRTPTGGMLWEIWARHKWSFLWQVAALGAALGFVQCKQHGASEIVTALLALATLAGFTGSYIQLLACFSHVEVDAVKFKAGYPGRLLLKPLSTFHLVMVPMVAGGLVAATMLTAWAAFVLKPLGFLNGHDLPRISVVMLSLFWWSQALAWGLPSMQFKSLVMVSISLLHLAVGMMPQLPWAISPPWQWASAMALLVTAMPAAWSGLALIRRGRWESPSRVAKFWGRFFPNRTREATRFRSAFAAQFWLEWQRQGILFPGLWGGMAVLMSPLVFFVFKWLEVAAPPPQAILAAMLLGPLVLSGVLGPAMAKFDQLDPGRELPVYISVRPMTNGGFVMAKLAMALVSSALALVLSIVGTGVCVAVTGGGNLFFKTGASGSYGFVSILIGCLPAFLFLVILVWQNLVAGMGLGLTGRPWITGLGSACRGGIGMGLAALIMAARIYEDFGQGLLHWLTVILIAGLTVKISVSIFAFGWGFRRNAITGRAIGWIAGGWFACGLFVAGYAWLVCYALNKPELWLWFALGAFLVLPLADLAVAPLAIAWNRHR